DIQALRTARDSGPHTLDIGIPASIGLLLRPGHVVPEARSLPADVTYGSHWSSLPLDCDLRPTSGQPRKRTRALRPLTNSGGEGGRGWIGLPRVAGADRLAAPRPDHHR